jgi:hypothetical protein
MGFQNLQGEGFIGNENVKCEATQGCESPETGTRPTAYVSTTIESPGDIHFDINMTDEMGLKQASNPSNSLSSRKQKNSYPCHMGNLAIRTRWTDAESSRSAAFSSTEIGGAAGSTTNRPSGFKRPSSGLPNDEGGGKRQKELPNHWPDSEEVDSAKYACPFQNVILRSTYVAIAMSSTRRGSGI